MKHRTRLRKWDVVLITPCPDSPLFVQLSAGDLGVVGTMTERYWKVDVRCVGLPRHFFRRDELALFERRERVWNPRRLHAALHPSDDYIEEDDDGL